MDFHCDGKVNYMEFMACCITPTTELLNLSFKNFENKSTGYICFKSMISVLKSSNLNYNEELLEKEFNSFSNNKITYDKFISLFIN